MCSKNFQKKRDCQSEREECGKCSREQLGGNAEGKEGRKQHTYILTRLLKNKNNKNDTFFKNVK